MTLPPSLLSVTAAANAGWPTISPALGAGFGAALLALAGQGNAAAVPPAAVPPAAVPPAAVPPAAVPPGGVATWAGLGLALPTGPEMPPPGQTAARLTMAQGLLAAPPASAVRAEVAPAPLPGASAAEARPTGGRPSDADRQPVGRVTTLPARGTPAGTAALQVAITPRETTASPLPAPLRSQAAQQAAPAPAADASAPNQDDVLSTAFEPGEPIRPASSRTVAISKPSVTDASHAAPDAAASRPAPDNVATPPCEALPPQPQLAPWEAPRPQPQLAPVALQALPTPPGSAPVQRSQPAEIGATPVAAADPTSGLHERPRTLEDAAPRNPVATPVMPDVDAATAAALGAVSPPLPAAASPPGPAAAMGQPIPLADRRKDAPATPSTTHLTVAPEPAAMPADHGGPPATRSPLEPTRAMASAAPDGRQTEQSAPAAIDRQDIAALAAPALGVPASVAPDSSFISPAPASNSGVAPADAWALPAAASDVVRNTAAAGRLVERPARDQKPAGAVQPVFSAVLPAQSPGSDPAPGGSSIAGAARPLAPGKPAVRGGGDALTSPAAAVPDDASARLQAPVATQRTAAPVAAVAPSADTPPALAAGPPTLGQDPAAIVLQSAPQAALPASAAPADPANPQPRDTAAAAMKQLAPALLQIAHASGGHQITLHLAPAELGRVDVRIDRAPDGTASVQVLVERAETLKLLQVDHPQLQQALNDAGLSPQGRSLTLALAPDTATAGQGGFSPGGFGAGGFGAGGFGQNGFGQSGSGSFGGFGGGPPHGFGRAGDPASSPAGQALPPRWQRAGIDITA